MEEIVRAFNFVIEKGWVRALPAVRFSIMNTVNASTGFAPFQLLQGRRPRVVPPLFDANVDAVCEEFPDEGRVAADVIRKIDIDVLEAQDNLTLAKTWVSRAGKRQDTIPEDKSPSNILLGY